MPLALSNARALATQAMALAVSPGDTVVDATMGNGHDTLMLAQLVGEGGQVIAFDIQAQATENTRCRLLEAGLLHRVRLIHSGHEHMAVHIHTPVAAVMFNLGWLPGGDKGVTTCTRTTLMALEAAFGLLSPGGVISMCIYPGHPQGEDERRQVSQYAASLDVHQAICLHARFTNALKAPPELILIQKVQARLELSRK